MLISKNRQHGFSMVEVLVSLAVIGMGLLGLSGLQIASVKGSNNAHSRNVAVNLVMDLSERMRANPLGVEGGFYENNVTCAKKEPSECKGKNFCSPERVARIDVQEVMCGVYKSKKREGGAANLLLNSNLTVDYGVDCDPNIEQDNETSITITWSDFNVSTEQEATDRDKSLSICVLP